MLEQARQPSSALICTEDAKAGCALGGGDLLTIRGVSSHEANHHPVLQNRNRDLCTQDHGTTERISPAIQYHTYAYDEGKSQPRINFYWFEKTPRMAFGNILHY